MARFNSRLTRLAEGSEIRLARFYSSPPEARKTRRRTTPFLLSLSTSIARSIARLISPLFVPISPSPLRPFFPHLRNNSNETQILDELNEPRNKNFSIVVRDNFHSNASIPFVSYIYI